VNYLIAASIAANPATGAPPLDVNFTYTGTPGISYVWDFGDGSPTDATQNPSHTYAVAGNYNVVMTVSINNTQSCTLTLIVVVENPSHLIIPNVFTPNGDGHNDIFMMDYMSIQSFSCLIFNRWGKKVYEWSDPATGWDGKLTSGGKAADGVYYYVIKAKGTDGVDYNEHGTVTLVRH
jgi:gliding motility-associated-like protein